MAAPNKKQEQGKVPGIPYNKAAGSAYCQRGVCKHEQEKGESPCLDHESFLPWKCPCVAGERGFLRRTLALSHEKQETEKVVWLSPEIATVSLCLRVYQEI